MASKLIDCGKKAVAAKLLTQEEVDFVSQKAKGLAETMPRADADIAAARAMVQDGINELQNIRNQLGKADPIKEPKILYRTTNKDAALAAMADETQAVVETKVLEEARKLQGDEGKILAGEQKAEGEILGPAPNAAQKAAPRPVDRQAEIAAAVERLNKNPAERVAVYQKIRDRMLSVMKANKIEIAGMGFERGMTAEERAAAGITRNPPEQHEIQKEKLLAAMGELNALLKFLPAEVRGKVGGFFQLAQGGLGETELADFFTKRVKMVEREMERMLKRDYLSEINKLIEKSKPKAGANKIKKSKIGDAQEAADIASKAAAMNEDQVALQLATLDSAMSNSDLTPEEHSALLYEWGVTDLFGDISHQNAETMAEAYRWLHDTVARGRAEWGAKEEKRLEQVKGFAAEIKAGFPPVTQEGVTAIEWDEKLRERIASFPLSHTSLAQFFEQILPGTEVAKRWSMMAQEADLSTQMDQINTGNRFTEAIQEAIGSKSRLAVGAAMWELKKVQRPGIKWGDKMVPMTKLQAIDDLLRWDQPDVREKMAKQGWTEDIIDQLRALTADDVSQAMIALARDEYAAGFNFINPVYKRMNGMNMPRISNYSPTRYHHQGREQEIGLYGGVMSVAGATPNFLRNRVKHGARLRQTDALRTLWQHLGQQSHYVHYAELLREMRGVMGSPDVKLALKQRYGERTVRQIDDWIDALARQGGNKATEIVGVDWILDSLMSGKAISAMGFNPLTVAKQADSAMRMLFTVPPKRVVAAMLDPKFIETLPIAFHSRAIQTRIQNGASPEARYMMEKTRARPSVALELARLSMMPVQMFDAYMTSFSAGVVYRDKYNEAIEQGIDDADAQAIAMDQMEEVVYRYSQPMGIANRSLAEISGNKFFKVFMMFMSDPRLKTSIQYESVRNVLKGNDVPTHLRRIFLVEMMAVLSHVIQNLYRAAFSDDDEEEIWTWQGFVKAAALAPLAGYFGLGTAWDIGLSKILGERSFTPTHDPLVDALEYGGRASRHLEDFWNTDEPRKMVAEWNNIARGIAVHPALAGPSTIINILKPVVHGIENAKED